jgi:hypothetical protein
MPVNYRNLAHSFLEKTVPTMIDLVDVTHELDVNPVKSHKSRTAPAPRLRYLKFKAKDVAKTAEFYQSMGMNMDYKLVIPLVVRDELIPATELNTKTLMAFSYPPITLSKEDYDARHQEGIIESNDKKPNFQIIFEHTPLAPVELSEVMRFLDLNARKRKRYCHKKDLASLKHESLKKVLNTLYSTFTFSLD